jgi:hypothetical protein
MTSALDRQRAIASFHRHGGRARQGRVRDGELALLFGAELAATVAELERVDREQGICAACGGRCCEAIGCAHYRREAPRCPIHAERPLLCRMHFCERFLVEHRDAVIALRDLYLAVLGDEPLGPPFEEENPCSLR